MDREVYDMVHRDCMRVWANQSADKVERWAGHYRGEDAELCKSLNRVVDALCDLIDQINEGGK